VNIPYRGSHGPLNLLIDSTGIKAAGEPAFALAGLRAALFYEAHRTQRVRVTPQAFIEKWQATELKERTASHSHFDDLCRLLDIEEPATADPKGDWFTFEKGASKTSDGKGWADVWRRNCFAWEYKGKAKDLDKAFAQLQQYSIALENPPLLVVSDMIRFRIHTNWTNTVQKVHEFTIHDLRDAATRDLLRDVFLNPENLKPAKTRQRLTEQAAEKFAGLAQRLREREYEGQTVAHFVNRLVFCMFAEDVNLLPNKMFQRMLEHCQSDPTEFQPLAQDLFGAMKSGGRVGFERVEWFNGGLFDDDLALPLEKPDLADLLAAARLDWSEIDPSILGTLFERGLDPEKRSQLGAHYTDRDKIMQIVGPVVVEPLLAEWSEVKAKIETELSRAKTKGRMGTTDKATRRATALKDEFKERLRVFRVLDPACGSGNFQYVALAELKNIEHRVNIESEALGIGLSSERPFCGPENMLGIELNPYAAELARVSVWVGDIQWSRRNGFEAARDPILRPLETIESRDAVLTGDGTRADWPDADAVVGNPPFLGNKKMIAELGEPYAVALRKAWRTVPGGADLVCYWFAKAWEMMQAGRLARAGLVATNSIRGGANRAVLKPVVEAGRIFAAWSDESWTVEGAAVRVSLVCFDGEKGGAARLDGAELAEVYSDLSGARGGVDLTSAKRLPRNRSVAFQGPVKVGPFDVAGEEARKWLSMPANPNGKSNGCVVFPLLNGTDITRRDTGRWIVNFDMMTEQEASLFEAPFEHVRRHVKPSRDKNRDRQRRENWWRLGRSGSDLKAAMQPLTRAIFTPRVSKHRVFIWAAAGVVPDSRVVAIARDDDTTFGILHSRFHEVWSLALGGWHGVGNDPQYTPSLGFETFPFPEGLTPDFPAADYADDPRAQAIATAAARLNELRENWLNPPDLVERVP
jgi:type II restriction/modification system DNA methylase subunit YeeA